MSGLWFARHGSTAWSERQRLQGWAPIGLSARGMDEAHAIGRAARERGIRRIITSPLRRARETAHVIAQYVPAIIYTEPHLRELEYGAVTGSTLEELAATHATLAKRWRHEPWDVRFTARHGALSDLESAMAKVLAASTVYREPTLYITHGHVIRTTLILTRAHAASAFWTIDVPTGSLWHLPKGQPLLSTS